MDKILTLLDRIFIATLVAWLVLKLLGTPVLMLLVIGLLGVAAIFFLQAYQPLDIKSEDENVGFEFLLGASIIPKVLGISSSVATVGILFYLLNMEGYSVMLTVGSLSIAIALLILIIIGLRGMKLNPIIPRLIKSLIVLAFAINIQLSI